MKITVGSQPKAPELFVPGVPCSRVGSYREMCRDSGTGQDTHGAELLELLFRNSEFLNSAFKVLCGDSSGSQYKFHSSN